MARMVCFDGAQVPDSQITSGSLFIKNCWYSSVDKMPANLRAEYAPIFDREKQYQESLEKTVKTNQQKQQQKETAARKAAEAQAQAAKAAKTDASGQPCVNC